MENFDRENIDELLEIRQIHQYFPPSKICAVRYVIAASNNDNNNNNSLNCSYTCIIIVYRLMFPQVFTMYTTSTAVVIGKITCILYTVGYNIHISLWLCNMHT